MLADLLTKEDFPGRRQDHLPLKSLTINAMTLSSPGRKENIVKNQEILSDLLTSPFTMTNFDH